MLKAYADENVTNAVVQALRKRGMDVVTVSDQGREGAGDESLFTEALTDKRVLMTNDRDFLPPLTKPGFRFQTSWRTAKLHGFVTGS